MHVDRNIKVNFRHNLVEVKHDKSEAIFELLDSEDGKTVTFKVSSWLGYYRETVVFKVGSCRAVTVRPLSLLRFVHAGLLREDHRYV